MAASYEDMHAIIEEVTRTRLTYMTGETSYYYPVAIYSRNRFKMGDFGHFVYG
jgi:hypothetical protein